MPTFFDLLKYAKTGIAVPDMTAYDKAKALAMCGGGLSPYTIIGQPPISFKSDGTPLTSVTINGNGVQSGTPSPQNIVPIDGTGERTGNLFDKSTITSGKYATLSGASANNYYYCSDFIPITATTYYFQNVVGGSYQNTVVVYDANKQGLRYAKLSGGANVSGSITFQEGDAYIRVNFYHQTDVDTVMVNIGNTALPYEPYGYKIPLTCAGQTVPVYLGEVSTTRRVRKLVLTGDESNWGTYSVQDGSYCAFLPLQNFMGAASSAAYAMLICTHYVTTAQNNIYNGTRKTGCSGRTNQGLLIRDENITSETDFKAFLQQQYAADNPVTIWYALATTETGIVNEPLMKIGDYADELHSEDAVVTIPTAKGSNTLTVDTTVQPSEVSITGNIKPTT